MKLSGLHLLLTYQCNFECDHCFVWGSPWQSGTMTLQDVREILRQAEDLGAIEWIYFEGGEPFLYYAVLLKGIQEAAGSGFRVGVVSNAYWATAVDDALEYLRPFAGLVQDLSVSSDLFHWSEKLSRQTRNACAAAQQLGIPVGVINIAQPEAIRPAEADETPLMYRGRAADKLVAQASPRPWIEFTECPYEELRDPERVHVDPLGNLHICQGISPGNLFRTPLRELCETYAPDRHPIIGPLLRGGPAELARRYGLPHAACYADACHLCYESRQLLRAQFPEILAPDQMYGVFDG